MTFKLINPESLGPPKGYSNGLIAEAGGRLLFVAGQIAWDSNQRIISTNIADQFDQALANVLTVVSAAGGKPDSLARLVIYVTSKVEYIEQRPAIGARYRQRMGTHYPTMVLVEVKSLLEDQAKVEIEAVAILD